MTALLEPADLERLRAAVAARLGLQLDDTKMDLLSTVAADRLRAGAAPSQAAWLRAVEEGARGELRSLAERLTVGETFFFRNPNDMAAFSGAVLPDRMRARAGARRLSMLSAGCSSGEEPYTLAMIARQVTALAGWDVAIRGIDVNPAAISRARAARYGAWSLRQTPDLARARFFRQDRREYEVVDDVRALVSFEERNLLDEDPAFWAAGAWDVVFCRNVLMYLAPETTRRIMARIATSLAPGGFLFLGHAETLRGISTEFHLRHTHGTFYYQRRDGAPAAAVVAAAPGEVSRVAAVVPALDGGENWLEAIRRASERIARLTTPPPLAAPAAAASAIATPPGPGAVARALALVGEDRLDEALAALGPSNGETDADALLLRAVILASRGDPAAADAICTRILELDELNAEAHYVKALCREHSGDREGAATHDRTALYLDPTFGMPRLHLGLLAKRAGDLARARRELSRALALLAGEDASRILLLGGGFTRAALVEVCRAELRACGGIA